jgi:hypothetical protein
LRCLIGFGKVSAHENNVCTIASSSP